MYSKYGYVEIDGIPIDIERLPVENIKKYIGIKKEQRKEFLKDQSEILIQYVNKGMDINNEETEEKNQ